MAARPIVTLNASTPQLEVPQSGDSYTFGARSVTGDSHTVEFENSTNAQIVNIYNTKTDVSNYERLGIKWDANVAIIGTEQAGTGTARKLRFSFGSGKYLDYNTTGAIASNATYLSLGVTYLKDDDSGIANATSYGRSSIKFRHPSSSATVQIADLTSDAATGTMILRGPNALSSASTNLEGGPASILGGDGASASAGAAHGGNVTIGGGTGYGTGHNGYVLTDDTIYGGISVQGGSAAEATTDGTPRLVAAWNTDGLSNGTTPDHTDDTILATVAGTYEVHAHVSFSGTAAKSFQLELYVYDDSGTAWGASGFAVDRKLGAGGDVGACAVMGLVALDVDDKVGLYHSSSDGGSAFTATEAQLSIKRISD